MKYPDIISVDETNFDIQVLEYSQRIPVLVDFWAQWSNLCQKINTLLEKLANEEAGRFRLALLDVDLNPQLTQRFQVHTVPTLKTFENGAITRQIEGVKTTSQVVNYVQAIVPGPEKLLLEKAASLLETHHHQEVEDICLEVLDDIPNQPLAKLLLAKSFLWQNRYQQALDVLDKFPSSPELPKAELLKLLAEQLTKGQEDLLSSSNQLDLIYSRVLKLLHSGKIPSALDGLLAILEKDKTYQSGLPHQLTLSVFELLGEDHPLTVEYRSLLANTLF
jgi:putative thioredoxin